MLAGNIRERLEREARKVIRDNPKAVAEFFLRQLNNLSKLDQEKLGAGLVQYLISEQGRVVVKQTAAITSQAIAETRQMMTTLKDKLAVYDNDPIYGIQDKFAPRIQNLHDEFNSVCSDSADQARKVAATSELMGKAVAALVRNDSIPLKTRQGALEVYLKNAEADEAKTSAIMQRFEEFRDRFVIFVGSFDSFALSKTHELRQKLDGLRQEAQELSDKINEIASAARTTMTVGGGAAIGVALLGLFFPPALPAVLVAAGTIAGVTTIAAAGMGASVNHFQAQLNEKNKEINAVSAQISAIETARTEIKKMGKDDIEVLRRNIGALTLTMQRAIADLRDVSNCLKTEQTKQELPVRWRTESQHLIALYNTMALYLRGYADGVKPLS